MLFGVGYFVKNRSRNFANALEDSLSGKDWKPNYNFSILYLFHGQ